MRIKKLLAFFLSMSFIVCSLPTLVFADEIDDAGSSGEPVVENVGDSESDPEDVAGAPADVKQGDNGLGDVKGGSDEVSGAPVVRGQNDNDGYSGDPVYSGQCGDKISWSFSPSDGLLDLKGSGEMFDYDSQGAPWSSLGIVEVYVDYHIESIGNYAFANCESLSYISFASTLKRIGDCSFLGCVSLTTITIPSNVKNLGDKLFEGCSNLSSLAIFPSQDSLQDGTLSNISHSTCIYVYDFNYDGYTERFSSIADQFEKVKTGNEEEPTNTDAPINTDTPITGTPVRKIKDSGNCGIGVFWTMYSDGELNIAGSGSMDDYTGVNRTPWNKYCEFITTIKINDQVEKIGSYAFSNLLNLKTVTIPSDVKILGDYAFAYSLNLRDIYCYSDPGSFSGNAFANIRPDFIIIHVKTRYCQKYESKYSSSNLYIVDDLSYVDLLGNTVVLSDQIGVNFYLDYSKYINISDLSVEFKWGKGSNAKTVSGTLSQDTSYGAKCVTSCSVPARCMTDSIKMTVKKGDDIVVSSTFKIAKYANDLTELYPAENVTTSDYIGLQDNQKLHTLLIAMLNYGAECQKYFNYNTDDLANAKKYTKNLVTVGSVSSSTKSAYSNYDATTMGLIAAKNTIANIGDDNIGLVYDGSAVACKSKLSVRIYFTKTESFDISNLSASYKGKALTFKEDGDSVYLQIDGMSPKAYAPKGSDLFDCGLTININGKDYTYTYLDYVQKCVVTENGFEDTAVALAVYSYFAANY